MMGLYITADVGSVDPGDPGTGVPDGGNTFFLLGLGLLPLAWGLRKKRQ